MSENITLEVVANKVDNVLLGVDELKIANVERAKVCTKHGETLVNHEARVVAIEETNKSFGNRLWFVVGALIVQIIIALAKGSFCKI